MEDKLVTLAIHTFEKAQMLKMILESEGIEVYIHNVNQIQPVISAGVRVRIKESDLARVFEKGFTGSDRTKSKSTGIGLYLAKKICNKLGLEINIYSKYKKWTKVEITYPKSNFNKME